MDGPLLTVYLGAVPFFSRASSVCQSNSSLQLIGSKKHCYALSFSCGVGPDYKAQWLSRLQFFGLDLPPDFPFPLQGNHVHIKRAVFLSLHPMKQVTRAYQYIRAKRPTRRSGCHRLAKHVLSVTTSPHAMKFKLWIFMIWFFHQYFSKNNVQTIIKMSKVST